MKTLHEHLDAFLEGQRSINRSASYLRMIGFSVRRTFRWLAEHHQVTEARQITKDHLEGWAKHVVAYRKKDGLPLKPASLAKQFDCDRVFVEWLEHEGVLPPGLSSVLPIVKQPDLLPQSVLVHQEVEKIFARVDITTPQGVQLKAMLELLYSSAIRPAELLALNLEDVDFAQGLARVTGKGQKERIVPFGKTARRFLENYVTGIRPLFLREQTNRALWLDRSGERMPYHTFRRRVVAWVAEISSAKPITSYTFRRSCATEMIRGGASLWILKLLLGHDRLDSLQHYVRMVPNDLIRAHAKCHPRERDCK